MAIPFYLLAWAGWLLRAAALKHDVGERRVAATLNELGHTFGRLRPVRADTGGAQLVTEIEVGAPGALAICGRAPDTGATAVEFDCYPLDGIVEWSHNLSTTGTDNRQAGGRSNSRYHCHDYCRKQDALKHTTPLSEEAAALQQL